MRNAKPFGLMLNAECGMRNDGEAQAAPAGSGAGAIGRMKPILFSTPMVQAILAGRKTMVRMPIKHQPDKSAIYMGIYCGRARFETDIDMWNMMLPYKPGDVLYVRETWARFECAMGIGHIYRADDGADGELWYCRPDRWRSPVTMPAEAARLFLRVTNVRVERVRDITEADTDAEGAAFYSPKFKTDVATIPWRMTTSRTKFCAFWDSIYVKRGYGWDNNPWVWVIEFERSEGA